MTELDLIKRAALRMDEISAGEDTVVNVSVDGIAQTDSNPLYVQLQGMVYECLKTVFATAPYWRLPQSEFDDKAIVPISGETGSRKIIKLKLPDDFLRIAEIDCADFERPITEVYGEQSVQGRRQHNDYLRAGISKPVGIMSHGVWSNTPAREIDCYSLPSDTAVTAADVMAHYIAIPAVADLPDSLEPAVEWLMAERVFAARGDTGHAQLCQANYESSLM